MICRSGHQHVFCIRFILKNFAKFRRNPLCQSVFFTNLKALNKGLEAWNCILVGQQDTATATSNFIKKETPA